MYRPGQRIETDSLSYSNDYDFQSGFGNMLGALAGSCAASAQYAGNYNFAQQNPMTEEELEARRLQREEEEALMIEEQKRKEALREWNRPKMIKSFVGGVFCLAFAVMVFSLNMSFHNTDYNRSVGSAVLWFLEVSSIGLTGLLGYLTRYYSK